MLVSTLHPESFWEAKCCSDKSTNALEGLPCAEIFMVTRVGLTNRAFSKSSLSATQIDVRKPQMLERWEQRKCKEESGRPDHGSPDRLSSLSRNRSQLSRDLGNLEPSLGLGRVSNW